MKFARQKTIRVANYNAAKRRVMVSRMATSFLVGKSNFDHAHLSSTAMITCIEGNFRHSFQMNVNSKVCSKRRCGTLLSSTVRMGGGPETVAGQLCETF